MVAHVDLRPLMLLVSSEEKLCSPALPEFHDRWNLRQSWSLSLHTPISLSCATVHSWHIDFVSTPHSTQLTCSSPSMRVCYLKSKRFFQRGFVEMRCSLYRWVSYWISILRKFFIQPLAFSLCRLLNTMAAFTSEVSSRRSIA